MIRKITFLFFIFLIQSCGGIRIRLPLATVTSPEILDEQVELDITGSDSRTYVPSNNDKIKPFVFDNEVLNSSNMNMDIRHKYKENFLFGIGLNSDFGMLLSTQYQLFKSRTNDSGFLSAIQVDYYFSNLTMGPQSLDSPDNVLYKHGVQAKGVNLSAGYRLNSSLMGYFGIGYKTSTLLNQIAQFSNADPTVPGIYTYNFDVNSTAMGLGLKIDYEKIHFIPAVEWIDVRIDQRHESFAVGSLMMEIHFN